MEAERVLESKLRQAENDGNIGDVVETLSIQDKKQALLIAVRNRLYHVVMYLLQHGVDVLYIDSNQNNLIHILLNNHHIDDNTDLLLQCVVKLDDAGIDVNQANDEADTPISIAARERLYKVVMYLSTRGVDINYVDTRQNNLLHMLLYSYNRHDNTGNLLLPSIVKLVVAGVDVNHTNIHRKTPIVIAAEDGLYEVVLFLLEHGVDIQYADRHQNNMLHTLLQNRYINAGEHDLLLQCVVGLVDAGVDTNQFNADEDTPIVIAAREGLYEVVLYLLARGVDRHYADSNHNTLLHTLLYCYNIEDTSDRRVLLLQCVAKLVEAGVDVSQMNIDKVTPIVIAARKGLHDVVLYLLEHGVDVHYIDSFKRNILHYVLSYMRSFVKYDEQYTQLVNTLINRGLDINQSDYKGNTPLFYVGKLDTSEGTHPSYAAKVNRICLTLQAGRDIHVRLKCQLINMLLDAGCNVSHQNELGRTALMHHIIYQADINILKLLIHHSDLSLTDNNGDTAISYCVKYHMNNSTPVFKLLVDSGSDLMSVNNGVKLLHDILKCKRLEVFCYYIRLKLIVNGVTAEGENMLHILARVNYDYSGKKFKWLLNDKLDINHPCSKTDTPTMIAAFLLNNKYLELLTRHPRLEVNAQNNQGHTALHLCIIGFTMFKDGLNKRRVNDVVKNYCKQIYPIYMACIDTLLDVDGIDVNIPDNGGRTTLMMAAMKNDRVLTRKLLQAGAIVTMLDYSGKSALQYLDIYQSVFDLTCFKLLLSNGSAGLLNIPCIGGNTIIQTALCFPRFWEPCQVICFIRYLVAENCCVQTLITSSGESSYNQIDLTELSSSDRDKLRKLLYLSGAQGEEIMTTLNFDEEDNDTIRSRGREEFVKFCGNISLKSLCRRNIRQNLGLGIKEKVKDLDLPYELNGFLLLNDTLHPQDYNLDHIDDGCNDFDDDDDYDGYDIDDRDDDYSQYKYNYFTLHTDPEVVQCFLKTSLFPNGKIDDDEGGDYYK